MITRGIAFILIATFSFAFMNALAKELMNFHPLQVVFFRAARTFAVIFPMILYKRIPIIGNNPKLLFYRALAGVLSLSTFFLHYKTFLLDQQSQYDTWAQSLEQYWHFFI